MGKQLDVYGIGNAIMDLQLFVSEEELASLGVEKGSMALVDAEKQKTILDRFSERPINRASGGSAANTIIALAQLGSKVAYGCKVGEDEFGKAYLSEMSELSVSHHTELYEGGATGTCIVMITPDAERTMLTCLGISAEFGPDDISEDEIANAEWLYIEGYLFSSEPGRAAVAKAIEIAKSNDTKVAVTFSDGFIVEVFGDALKEAVASADLVFANAIEAKAFTGASEESKAFEELAKQVSSAVVTLGVKGALVASAADRFQIDPFPTVAVDDTGAGDMFAGGYLHGVSEGRPADECGKIACRLASEVVSQLGPRLKGDLRERVAEVA